MNLCKASAKWPLILPVPEGGVNKSVREEQVKECTVSTEATAVSELQQRIRAVESGEKIM